ncbi:MAG: AAA family ATPase [Gemmatimonadetes bacterium]|nr:AAA family ATPase [Gemmatimonadota bacterium]
MGLHALYGHESLLHRLEGTIASGRFPQTVLLVGPAGVGKQRLALHIAESLFCHDEGEAPRGECRASRQVRQLSHPDLHWFIPIVPPAKRSGDPEKQIQDTEEALAEALAERRKNPIYRSPDGRATHSVASARLLQRKVRLTPFQARRKVVILGDADRLVLHEEAAGEAANALLKVLEEPPEDTTLILTSSVPEALLPTIRSRMVSVRVGPLRDEQVQNLLSTETGMSPGEARRVSQLAGGSVTRALGVADAGDDGAQAAKRFLDAIRRGPEAWAGEALLQQAWGARGGFSAMLDALTIRLRSKLRRSAEQGGADTRNYLDAIRLVEAHRDRAMRNVNPQLALAVLASEVAEVL